ncbi:hypothetical protein NHX12_002551 [Muraenolepis orangiensis]|uniref:Uncharacterized protein n=1 Tax=Muraenolepis orangiensis TaxID=630683 RepID=A0A9Q0ID52_9TELE|nr:hypothetical protein NHX12_002551 [Muraenolepis orangiensis]
MGRGERGSSGDQQKDRRPIFRKEEDGPGRAESPRCCGCRFPLLVAALQLLLGLSTAAVAFLTLNTSRSLSARETPHWAGITVSSSSSSSSSCACYITSDSRITLQALSNKYF